MGERWWYENENGSINYSKVNSLFDEQDTKMAKWGCMTVVGMFVVGIIICVILLLKQCSY